MDAATKKKVEATVLEILQGSDMDSMTEYRVRKAAADRLRIDLSIPERKLFVRGIVEEYLRSLASQEEAKAEEEEEEEEQGGAGRESKDKEREEEGEEEEEEDDDDDDDDDDEEEEEEEEEAKGRRKREYDDQGDLILCRLSNKRRVTLSEFKGRSLVSIREFYLKDGKEMPSAKGLSMTMEQWEAFCNAVPAIEDAIKKLEDSD